jgi:hypothetical protein
LNSTAQKATIICESSNFSRVGGRQVSGCLARLNHKGQANQKFRKFEEFAGLKVKHEVKQGGREVKSSVKDRSLFPDAGD